MKYMIAALMLAGLATLSGCNDEPATFAALICEHDVEPGVSWTLEVGSLKKNGDGFTLHPRDGELSVHETSDPYEGECSDAKCVGNKLLPQNRTSIVSIDRLTGKATFSINEDDAVRDWWHATCERHERKF